MSSSQQENPSNEFVELLHEDEYQTQFFDFSPYHYFNHFKIHILDIIKTCTNKMRKSILDKCKSTDEQKSVEILIQNLQDKYSYFVDLYLKEAEPKISSIFKIPSHILLPEDEAQIHQYTENDIQEIDEEIKLLESRYKRAVCMELLLKNEKKMCFKYIFSMEKKLFEVDDDIENLSIILNNNKETMELVSNMKKDLTYVLEQMRNLLCENIKDNMDEYICKKISIN